MSDNEFVRQADRAASAILAEHGLPATQATMHALLAYAYALGAKDELLLWQGRIEESQARLLDVLGGAA